jgi:predicted unusual protein kinase regulating ubiquinone biosynthesis (AarF/ABC1/UbiB family)
MFALNFNLFILILQGFTLFLLRFLKIVSEETYYSRIAEMIKGNGVVFVKLAQILSSRQDNGGLPRPLTLKLRDIQDKCFYHFNDKPKQIPGLTYLDTRPISAGSICNIHRTTYAGQSSVIKTAHNNVQTYINDSILTLRHINYLYNLYSGYDLENNINLTDYGAYITQQLDLAAEARYQSRMREVFRPYKQIHVPEVYAAGSDYVIMEYIEGMKYHDFIALYPERTMECISLIYCVVYRMILSGCIHGDMHFGNFSYFLASTGCVHMNILDYGIMLNVSPVQLRMLQNAFNIMDDSKTCIKSFLDFISTIDPALKARLSKVDLEKEYTMDEIMGLSKNVQIPLPFVAFLTTMQTFFNLIQFKTKAQLTDIICYMIENDFIEF